MPKKKRNKAAKIDYSLPQERGCFKCNRWDDFMKKVWESEHEICPEDSCFMLLTNPGRVIPETDTDD